MHEGGAHSHCGFQLVGGVGSSRVAPDLDGWQTPELGFRKTELKQELAGLTREVLQTKRFRKPFLPHLSICECEVLVMLIRNSVVRDLGSYNSLRLDFPGMFG